MAAVHRLVRIVALVIIVLVLLAVISRYMPGGQLAEINYSTFLDDVKASRVDSVVFQGDMLHVTLKDKQQFETHRPEIDDSALIGTLKKAGVSIERRPPKHRILPWLLLLLAPLLLILVFVRRPADR